MFLKRTVMLMVFILGLALIFGQTSVFAGKALNIDVRHRPPEMIVKGNNFSGPLIDIIKEAAEKCGYSASFRSRQFKGSLEMLKKGNIDILPRTLCNQKRAAVIDYLGPIGYQEKDIVFIVKPGKENLINAIDDLEKLRIGTKRGTYYFDKFNNNPRIKKIETGDDSNLVKMFAADRFDAFIALDKKSAEAALTQNNVKDYTFANYKHTKRIGNYFGITPKHNDYDKLQEVIEGMVLSGRVKQIYEEHNVAPPVFETAMGFDGCFDQK